MSYILEALKKAEEARGAAPRAVAVPPAAPTAASQRWPWIAGGLGALAGAVALVSFWAIGPVTTDAPARTTVAAVPAPASPVVTPATIGVAGPPPVTVREPVLPPPAAAAEARPTLAPPGVERPPVARADSGREAPPRPQGPTAPASAQTPVPRASAPAERAVTASTATPSAAPAASGPRSEAVAPPTVQAERVIPRPSGAPPSTAGAPAGDLKALIAKLTLQVLSWSPDPKERFVFVNGRKYVEGQAIDDKLLIERITDGGILLSYQGERATLRSP